MPKEMPTDQGEDFSQRTQIIDNRTVVETQELSADSALAKLPVKSRDRYKFLRTIGFGGMKTVLLVYDEDTQRNLAMALMPDFRERPAYMVRRFVQEARITAHLEHPNIVSVHDIGVDTAGTPFFTMRYLRGGTLATILRRMRAAEPDAIRDFGLGRLLLIFRRVCNAMAYAHSQNVIHLDLKPENVHVSDFGDVQVLDWGLARIIDDDMPEEPEEYTGEFAAEERAFHAALTGKTIDGVAKGTPGFMAPEQAAGRNREKDRRSDIYSLGCILYSILTFTSPLRGMTPQDALKATIEGQIEPPSELKNPIWTIPPGLEAICLKAMEVDPANRYQSVAELLNDIRQFTGGGTPRAQISLWGRVVRFARENLMLALMAALVTLLLMILALLILLMILN